MDDRDALGRRVSTMSIALNGGLALIKLVTGVVGQSYALVADAVESFSDIFSSAIVYGGLVIAARPADEDHPYGHGKAEPLAALAVALMLILAAVGIAVAAIEGARGTHGPPAPYTLVVLVGVIIIKEAMYRYEHGIGKRLRSSALRVDAWHHRSDALTSAVAAVGITIALIGGDKYATADDWAALAACSVIVFNGVRFSRQAVAELMDTMPETTLIDSIGEAVEEVEGAHFVEKVLVRKMGAKLYVDLHLEVEPTLTVHKAHSIAHDVKGTIIAKRPEVADVLVHIEPRRSGD